MSIYFNNSLMYSQNDIMLGNTSLTDIYFNDVHVWRKLADLNGLVVSYKSSVIRMTITGQAGSYAAQVTFGGGSVSGFNKVFTDIGSGWVGNYLNVSAADDFSANGYSRIDVAFGGAFSTTASITDTNGLAKTVSVDAQFRVRYGSGRWYVIFRLTQNGVEVDPYKIRSIDLPTVTWAASSSTVTWTEAAL